MFFKAWVSDLGLGHILAKGVRTQCFPMRGLEH